jgi:hypothetical protein
VIRLAEDRYQVSCVRAGELSAKKPRFVRIVKEREDGETGGDGGSRRT